MKGFLWAGFEVVHGGKCLVAWSRVQRTWNWMALGWPTSLFLVGHFVTVGFSCGEQTQRGRGRACLVKLTWQRKLSSMH
jgi:hypothetical protein